MITLSQNSHAPLHKPHALSEAVREKVLELRREGIKPEQERLRMPAKSSMGDLLKQ